ncbi:hypothetical protein [Romboutsia sp.]|uniref:hypothetical protein n=1 Tax=Romboutsia sp. TaxID=1965302 RepID=UPI003F2C5A2E
MKKVNFKSKIYIMGSVSFVGSVFLIVSIIGLVFNLKWLTICSILMYFGCKIIGIIIWRCSKCKSNLPKGQYTHNINECSYCKYQLS